MSQIPIAGSGRFNDYMKRAQEFFGPSQDWSDQLKMKALEEGERLSSPNLEGSMKAFFDQAISERKPENIKKMLELGREDAFEKGKTGLMFSTLAGLPQTIANAVSPYGGPIGSRMAYEGMSRIPGIYSETMRTFPRIQVPASSYSPRSYFQVA